MASKVYPKFKEAILQAEVNLSSVSVVALLVDLADYTYSDAHSRLSDVPAGARVDVSAALTGKTFANGVFDADDTMFVAATGDQSEAVILINDTPAAEGDKHLIAFIDQFASGVPVTPDGGNLPVVWDDGANKVFSI